MDAQMVFANCFVVAGSSFLWQENKFDRDH